MLLVYIALLILSSAHPPQGPFLGVEHGWQTSGLWFIRALVLQRSAQAAEIRNGVILEGGGLVDGKNGRKRRRPTCPDPNAESEKQGY